MASLYVFIFDINLWKDLGVSPYKRTRVKTRNIWQLKCKYRLHHSSTTILAGLGTTVLASAIICLNFYYPIAEQNTECWKSISQYSELRTQIHNEDDYIKPIVLILLQQKTTSQQQRQGIPLHHPVSLDQHRHLLYAAENCCRVCPRA